MSKFTYEQWNALEQEIHKEYVYRNGNGPLANMHLHLELILEARAARDALKRQVQRLQTSNTIESDSLGKKDDQLLRALAERDEWKTKYEEILDLNK